MMKMMKKLGTVVMVAAAGYVGLFALWSLLFLACLDYERMHGAGYCGGDELTKVVRVLYAPVIGALTAGD